ncbi:MAG: hypothetical protein ACK46X_12525, partial [Candidatus Sericytochromatia bacterium]
MIRRRPGASLAIVIALVAASGCGAGVSPLAIARVQMAFPATESGPATPVTGSPGAPAAPTAPPPTGTSPTTAPVPPTLPGPGGAPSGGDLGLSGFAGYAIATGLPVELVPELGFS